MNKFWKPAWGNPLFLAFPLLMWLFTLFYTAKQIRDWVAEVSYQSSVYAIELLTERGPFYAKSCDYHAETIEMWLDRSDKSFPASVVRLVFPRLSLRGRFGGILADLEIASDGRDAELAISKTAEELVQFSRRAVEFAGGPRVWPRRKTNVPGLGGLVENAITKSESLVDDLQGDLNSADGDPNSLQSALEDIQGYLSSVNDDPNRIRIAQELCQQNRKAMLLIILARVEENQLQRFYTCIERSAHLISQVANTALTPEDVVRLRGYVKSETFRMKIIDAMGNNDVVAAHELLSEAIVVAFKERGPQSRAE